MPGSKSSSIHETNQFTVQNQQDELEWEIRRNSEPLDHEDTSHTATMPRIQDKQSRKRNAYEIAQNRGYFVAKEKIIWEMVPQFIDDAD